EGEGKTAKQSREDAALTPDAAEVPEIDEVAPVVTIDFENESPLPSDTVAEDSKREFTTDRAFK
ncbi:MAG: hypothetical protein IKP64_02990, partial [Selenomonadaceae bacterium]|nr:hypothetical protein [Selenomonadaceae bacterium]